MVIREFGAIHFRNYHELFVTFSGGINLFVGGNGQGKTNLAEGLYFLTHLDSFRTHRLEQLITFGESLSYVQGAVLKEEVPCKARVELSARGRRAWLDDEAIPRLSDYASLFYALLFNPDSLYAYRHEPSERRRFFDRFAAFVDRECLTLLRDFREVRRSKNRLLKSGDLSSLPEWNRLFIEKGCGIIKKRYNIVAQINDLLPGLFRRLSGRSDVLRLDYRPTLRGEPGADATLLERAADAEWRAGHALYGPHRDDFAMRLGGPGQEAERGESFFSQGEYRVALLALKLALNELVTRVLGQHPVLILDDLYSELDDGVRRQLTGYLLGIPNQIFITTTESPAAVGLPEARIMEIRDGRIR